MARSKEFDPSTALDAAIGVFREHGFAASSAAMLTDAMQVGRQSIYDTFGDKWGLYCSAVERYCSAETSRHFAALNGAATPYEGIVRFMARVVEEAHLPCLGIGSVTEFGVGRADLVKLHEAAGRALHAAVSAKVLAAQQDGDIAADVDVDQCTSFLLANVAAIRISARGGASRGELDALAALALRALR